jgi:hypothetical protein
VESEPSEPGRGRLLEVRRTEDPEDLGEIFERARELGVTIDLGLERRRLLVGELAIEIGGHIFASVGAHAHLLRKDVLAEDAARREGRA